MPPLSKDSNIHLLISVPILPIFLFQNELRIKNLQNPSVTTTGPEITQEILLEKIVEDSLVQWLC